MLNGVAELSIDVKNHVEEFNELKQLIVSSTDLLAQLIVRTSVGKI